MGASLETRALGLGVLAALVSLCGALLAAGAIKWLMASNGSEGVAPAHEAEVVTSPALVEQGHQFFTMSCAGCHGEDAHGDEGPDLHNLTISNGRIAATIKKGVKGEMPTFAKKYDDGQIRALVSYLRTLH